MPNRYHRPPSSHWLSHLKARRPTKKARTEPTRLENIGEARLAVPLACSAWMRRIVSRTTTGGVRTTGNAKLKVSAAGLGTPASIRAEMVAPVGGHDSHPPPSVALTSYRQVRRETKDTTPRLTGSHHHLRIGNARFERHWHFRMGKKCHHVLQSSDLEVRARTSIVKSMPNKTRRVEEL
jgi:hypothetical protein